MLGSHVKSVNSSLRHFKTSRSSLRLVQHRTQESTFGARPWQIRIKKVRRAALTLTSGIVDSSVSRAFLQVLVSAHGLPQTLTGPVECMHQMLQHSLLLQGLEGPPTRVMSRSGNEEVVQPQGHLGEAGLLPRKEVIEGPQGECLLAQHISYPSNTRKPGSEQHCKEQLSKYAQQVNPYCLLLGTGKASLCFLPTSASHAS